MCRSTRCLAMITISLWMGFASATCQYARAQPIVISTPFQNVQDSYSEFFGLNWGFSRPLPHGGGIFFNSGGGLPFVPFGPPFSGAHIGAQGRVGHWHYHWNLFAGQGSSRTIVSQTPMLTVTNGYPGYFFSGQWRPFVTVIYPVVGEYRVSPLALRLEELKARGETISPVPRGPDVSSAEDAVGPAHDPPPVPLASGKPRQDDPPLLLGKSGDK